MYNVFNELEQLTIEAILQILSTVTYIKYQEQSVMHDILGPC